MKCNKLSTLTGWIALVIWSQYPILVGLAHTIPIFEILAIAFSINFVCTLLIINKKNAWSKMRQPLIPWVIGVLGIFGNEALFISSTRFAPIAQVILLFYLWPIFTILISSFLKNTKISFIYLIGCLLGLAGIYVLYANQFLFSEINSQYIVGYLLSISGAIVWSIYALANRQYSQAPTELIGLYCGVAALLSGIIHITYEKNILPSLSELAVIIIMGLTTQGCAYFMWDHGCKKGNFNLLCLLSYFNLPISLATIIFFKFSQLSFTLAIACILLVSANIYFGISKEKSESHLTKINFGN